MAFCIKFSSLVATILLFHKTSPESFSVVQARVRARNLSDRNPANEPFLACWSTPFFGQSALMADEFAKTKALEAKRIREEADATRAKIHQRKEFIARKITELENSMREKISAKERENKMKTMSDRMLDARMSGYAVTQSELEIRELQDQLNSFDEERERHVKSLGDIEWKSHAAAEACASAAIADAGEGFAEKNAARGRSIQSFLANALVDAVRDYARQRAEVRVEKIRSLRLVIEQVETFYEQVKKDFPGVAKYQEDCENSIQKAEAAIKIIEEEREADFEEEIAIPAAAFASAAAAAAVIAERQDRRWRLLKPTKKTQLMHDAIMRSKEEVDEAAKAAAIASRRKELEAEYRAAAKQRAAEETDAAKKAALERVAIVEGKHFGPSDGVFLSMVDEIEGPMLDCKLRSLHAKCRDMQLLYLPLTVLTDAGLPPPIRSSPVAMQKLFVRLELAMYSDALDRRDLMKKYYMSEDEKDCDYTRHSLGFIAYVNVSQFMTRNWLNDEKWLNDDLYWNLAPYGPEFDRSSPEQEKARGVVLRIVSQVRPELGLPKSTSTSEVFAALIEHFDAKIPYSGEAGVFKFALFAYFYKIFLSAADRQYNDVKNAIDEILTKCERSTGLKCEDFKIENSNSAAE